MRTLPPVVAIAIASAVGTAQRDTAWHNDLAPAPVAAAQAGNIALDPASGQLVLWRGNGQLHTWDGAGFSLLATTTTAVTGAAIAVSAVPGFDGVLTFGGVTAGGTVISGTQLYARGGLRRFFPTVSPPARQRASMASSGGTPVLFGGVDATGTPLDDLWIFTVIQGNPRWLQAIGTTPPSPRDSAAFCADGNGLLLFGGRTGTTLHNDTWRLVGFGWTQLSPTVSPPPGIGPMSFDPVRGEVIHVDPVSRTTWRFDPAADDWQALPTPAIALSTPFAATTTGGLSYMAFDPERSEHVFVDAGAGLSVFDSADATLGRRQPATCAPRLGIALSFGTPRLGNTWLVDVTGAGPSGAVWHVVGSASAPAPLPLDTNGCLAFVDVWLLLDAQLADSTGRATFLVNAPNDPAFVGFAALHQAYEPLRGAPSDELVVRVGR